ncbi:MAG: hypothetical protein WC612_00600 [Bdellovibrionales bacterium]|jgi:hypothetical protein
MEESVTWAHVLSKSHELFFHERPKNDLTPMVAIVLFERRVLALKLSPAQAIGLLEQSEFVIGFLAKAESLAEKGRRDFIEHTQKLTNIEQSNARIENTLSLINAAAAKIEASSNKIEARTESIAVTIEKAVIEKLDEAIRHAFKAAENTALKAAIKAAIVTSAISTIIFGLPANLATSYYYDRNLSVDAQKRAGEPKASVTTSSGLPPIKKAKLNQESMTYAERALPFASSSFFVRLEQDSYGLRSAATGKNMVGLLRDGSVVSMPLNNEADSVCLRSSPPIICKPRQLVQ